MTEVTPVKFKPVMVILVEVMHPPTSGENAVMTGSGLYTKPLRVWVPPGVVTLTAPEVPGPTTA